jgi:hypothetical protein
MNLAASPDNEWKGIFQNTKGIIFLGTPHRGSPVASGANLAIRLTTCHQPPPLLYFLRAKSQELDKIANEFTNIWKSRPIYSFCETRRMGNMIIVIHHSTFLQRLSHQLLLSDCPQGLCDHKLSKRDDI